MNKLKLVFSTILLMSSAWVHAQVVFSEDFTGSKNWGFDSISDPQTQIAGDGQLTYSYIATTETTQNETSYVEKAFTLSPVTTDETGTLVVSGTIDLSGITFGTFDYDKRNFLQLTTSSGNRSRFDGGGTVLNLSVGGYRNPGQYDFSHSLAVRFGGGGYTQLGGFTPGGDFTYDFETTLTISEINPDEWLVEASTNLTNDDGTMNLLSSYTRTDAGFFGLQSIDGIQIGLRPDDNDGSLKADGPETLGAGVFAVNNVTVEVIPEPSTIVLVGLALGMLLMFRRRR